MPIWLTHFFASQNKYFVLAVRSALVCVSLRMHMHVLICIRVLNWIYDAPLSETPPSPQTASDVDAAFGPGILSQPICASHPLQKAIIIRPIPPPLATTASFSGSPARHIRNCNWAGGSFSLLITMSEDDSVSSSLPLNALQAPDRRGPEGAGFEEVGGNSVTGSAGRGSFYWSLGGGGALFFWPHSCALTRKDPKKEKTND